VGEWIKTVTNMNEDTTIKKLAEKIAKDFNLTIKERTDKLLQLSATGHSNIGIDSSKDEKIAVKSDSKYIFKQVKGIDERLGNLLVGNMYK
tara:strand:- start:469 stop:741 length:273 start_codon:yes stop_codon:yes gene_type:complete